MSVAVITCFLFMKADVKGGIMYLFKYYYFKLMDKMA